MVPSLESLGITEMSVDERLVLIHRIWESIATHEEKFELTDELRSELNRRAEDCRLHPEQGISLETVRADALRRLGK